MIYKDKAIETIVDIMAFFNAALASFMLGYKMAAMKQVVCIHLKMSILGIILKKKYRSRGKQTGA